MTHLLVTNDFPPKMGGIQSYLWELWRRLDPARFEVLTTAHPEAAEFDARQPFKVHRSTETQFLPTPRMVRTIEAQMAETCPDLVVLDPALPIGLVGPRLGRPYALVLHGAEVTVPGRIPVTRQLLGHVLRRAVHVIAAGGYPAAEGERVAGAGRMPPVTVIPPGIDGVRFHPLAEGERSAARQRFGVPEHALVVSSVSRLVPRKGMDVLIDATAGLAREFPDLVVLISGDGRDRDRLEKKIGSTSVPVRLLGAVDDADLPALYGCSDVFAMLCRNRWAGLEQEGFGIVFLEAAACGVPQVAGRSGGSAEAVLDGRTGLVVGEPRRAEGPDGVAAALRALLADADLRSRLGGRARQRVLDELSYDLLASRLGEALATVGG
ncbi:MAG: glycosyltransferase family 4 protein [Acidimicrobiales bacterium]